jgi:aldehyde dehydrogenase (NAD+)
VLERVKERIKHFKPGIPTDPATTMGAIISKAQLDRVMSYIASAKQEGARPLCGGGPPSDPKLANGFYVEPTVFADVTMAMRIAREEIFGPVLSILKFKDTQEVIRRANDTCYGLAAAVWTRNLQRAHQVAANVRAGTVWVNCYDVFDAAAPFGGFKMSGIGRELGEAGLANYTELKTVTVSLAAP